MDTGLWDSGQSTMARNQDVGRGIITRDEESKVIQYPFLYEGIIQSACPSREAKTGWCSSLKLQNSIWRGLFGVLEAEVGQFGKLRWGPGFVRGFVASRCVFHPSSFTGLLDLGLSESHGKIFICFDSGGAPPPCSLG